MTMIPIWLVIILLVLALLTLAAFKRGPFTRRSAAGDLRHPVVRILCAVMLLAILGATAWFTWQDQKGSTSPSSKVLAATQPSQLWPTSEPFASIDPGPCKLIFNLFLLDPVSHKAVWGKSTVLRWPEDRGRTFRITSESAGIHCDAEIIIEGFMRKIPGQLVHPEASLNLRTSHWRQTGFINGPVESIYVEDNQIQRSYIRHPLSLAPYGNECYLVAYQMCRAETIDPLREVDCVLPQEVETPGLQFQTGIQRLSSDAPPGAKMLEHTGPASFLLLLAAAFGAQCFRRRGIAFTALLAGMVLYAGTLDYAILRRHAARAADESLTPAQRHSAAIQAGQTFFHQPAARKLLHAAKQFPAEAER